MTTRHGSATVTLPSDREILITRTLRCARRARVGRTHPATPPPALVGPRLLPARGVRRRLPCRRRLALPVPATWTATNSAGTARTARSHRRRAHRVDRGVRGLSRRRVREHDDPHRARRRHDAAHAGVAPDHRVPRRPRRLGHGGRHAAHVQPARRPARLRPTRLRNGSVGSPVASPTGPTRCRPAAWDNPAPCDGWTARDVVDHLVTWVPGFMSSSAGHRDRARPPGRDRSGRCLDEPRRSTPGASSTIPTWPRARSTAARSARRPSNRRSG